MSGVGSLGTVDLGGAILDWIHPQGPTWIYAQIVKESVQRREEYGRTHWSQLLLSVPMRPTSGPRAPIP